MSKQREHRRSVHLGARLREDTGWRDVTICNVSTRGLMVKCVRPPAKGDFVELQYRGLTIVGHVRWSQGQRFGLRTQDRIDIFGLNVQLPQHEKHRGVERRSEPRLTPRLSPTAARGREEAGRHVGRALQWALLVGAGIIGVGLIVTMAVGALQKPLSEARSAFGGLQGK